ncbi:uncharacterized protein YgbK (DUF1537 family) [Fonticella tunisiensis]|uniref:Uncharacterized protein YgbK (DUF1537 family) n=2 Tax=Fonticella tunisiensis TaxID=1096341 RepID=A0A4R7KCB4_9CLOT|nr:uncharacterized protein YgbK (DUF1537 family) [Fonticella tunisiensis]
MIKNAVDVPVVEIKMSPFDILRGFKELFHFTENLRQPMNSSSIVAFCNKKSRKKQQNCRNIANKHAFQYWHKNCIIYICESDMLVFGTVGRNKGMDKFLIIADDFTGANDTGVQFTKRGIPTKVIFSKVENEIDCQALVVDTESRGLSGEEAYKRVKEISESVLTNSFNCVYKKVDSTLRGNIAEEVKALYEVYRPELVVFAPAYPANHRTTINGIQHISNTPVSKTEIGRDPIKPVIEDDITKLLQGSIGEKVVHVPIDSLRSGNLDFSNNEFVTFDAAQDEDLIKIVKLVGALKKKTLWVGSAGLANAIMQVNIPSIPVLGVVGSVSEVSRNQVHFAQSKGVKVVRVNIAELLRDKNLTPYIEEAVNELKQGCDTILVSSYNREDYEACIQLGSKMGISKEEISTFTQQTLGKIVENILTNAAVSGLFLTGGDTAIEVIRHINAKGSRILQEVVAGIPLMQLEGGPFHGLRVITKAGAFGEINAIDFCIQKLKEAL